MIKQEKIHQLLSRFDAVESELASGPASDKLISLSKEHADLSPVVEMLKKILATRDEILELKDILGDKDTDPEMHEMAKEEASDLEKVLPNLEHELQILLLPKDVADEKNAILEVRAGTGGDEAALFAGDLFRMYKRYAELNGWKVQIISGSSSERGGFKEISANVTGKGVFAKMKYEIWGSQSANAYQIPNQAGAYILQLRPLPYYRKLKLWMLKLKIKIYA